jgi:hypothetical protein
MAKPLQKPPPTSSVARLFDIEAASRALSQPLPSNDKPAVPDSASREPEKSNVVTPPFPRSTPSGEPANIKREFVLSPSTDETFSRLVDLYRRSTGTRLSGSHVARAMLRGVATCLDSLQREANGLGRLKLPSNARGREGERERFEEALAERFINGIRSAAAYRRDGT